MNDLNLHNCIKCGGRAVWMYQPSFENSNPENNFFCDKCVNRGCSCNNKNYGRDYLPYEEEQDELGRLLPCIEYIYCEIGFPVDDEYKYVYVPENE